MGLTDNQKKLIQAVSQNDIISAIKYATVCLTEDTTEKNKIFCSKYKHVLQSSCNNMIELPYDLKNILCVEYVSGSFKEGRYYLSSREKSVYENIILMKKISSQLMEKGVPYINSTLLYGESGTGKTTFGRYVALKMNLPFCYLNFSNLVNSRMGSTSKNISEAFSYITTNPCVFMLDEIDCISIRRSSANSSDGADGEMARITITLMQEFDKLTNSTVIIGATNRKDRIDEALLRRFSLKHEVKILTDDEKSAMVRKYIADVDISLSENEISKIVISNSNQAMVLNSLIRKISEKIANEIEQ